MKKSIFAVVLASMIGFSFTWVSNSNEVNEPVKKESVKEVQSGIKFAKMTLEQAKEMAKKKKKPIFIDCYTTWCGPCKMMASREFTKPSVGEYFNKNFINLKVEMEKDPDGRKIMGQYKITAYPTLLFINAKGELQRKAVGYKTAEQLLQIAKSV